jgi:hypothetical protein
MMGFFTPMYFFICILFLIDKLDIVPHLVQIGFSLPHKLIHPLYLFVTIFGLLFLVIIGFYGFQQHVIRLNMYVRRAWTFLFAFFGCSLLVAFMALSPLRAQWVLMVPSLSIIVPNALLIEKSNRFTNFVFYFSLLLLIFCQLALNK